MSKKMVVGTTLPGCFVLALVCAMLVLPGRVLANPPDESGNHSHGDGGGGGGGGGGGDSGGTIPVTATFRDFQGDDLEPVPDRLMSDFRDCPETFDCLSPYTHKVDGVSAGISTRGNFRMTLAKGNQTPIRTIFYDFSDCIEGPCEPPFPFGFTVRGANVHATGVNMREMSVGEVRGDLSLVVTILPEGSGSWLLFFDPASPNGSGSTYITLTRIDADTWEIEAGIDDVATLARQASAGERIFSGLYRMPFKITVQK